jgi:hypothetical protein
MSIGSQPTVFSPTGATGQPEPALHTCFWIGIYRNM